MTRAAKLSERRTADDYPVALWDDGAVSAGRLGTTVKGAGVARTPEGVAANVRAGWLVIGEAFVYDRRELPTLVAVARKMARGNPDAIDLNEYRRRVAAALSAAGV